MNRTLTYHIEEKDEGLRIEQYLRRNGYSRQNLTDLKKMHKSVLLNGTWVYLTQTLSAGNTLVIRIQETAVSTKIPPAPLPLHILYEDEDILVVNKPAGLPIHPSMNNYYHSLANACAYYYLSAAK